MTLWEIAMNIWFKVNFLQGFQKDVGVGVEGLSRLDTQHRSGRESHVEA